MKAMVNSAAALLVTLYAGLVTAYAQEDIDCDNAQNTVEMRFCASRDFEAADQRLNKAYRYLIRRLDAEPLAILRTSQRTWIGFRDAECEFQAYWTKGGTASPQVGTQCMAALTETRVRQLEANVNCEAGGMMCPPTD